MHPWLGHYCASSICVSLRTNNYKLFQSSHIVSGYNTAKYANKKHNRHAPKTWFWFVFCSRRCRVIWSGGLSHKHNGDVACEHLAVYLLKNEPWSIAAKRVLYEWLFTIAIGHAIQCRSLHNWLHNNIASTARIIIGAKVVAFYCSFVLSSYNQRVARRTSMLKVDWKYRHGFDLNDRRYRKHVIACHLEHITPAFFGCMGATKSLIHRSNHIFM